MLIKKSYENEKKHTKKTKNNNKQTENDQLTGHFQSLFIFFFRPPDPKSENKIP